MQGAVCALDADNLEQYRARARAVQLGQDDTLLRAADYPAGAHGQHSVGAQQERPQM
jgi:hypothetical protein